MMKSFLFLLCLSALGVSQANASILPPNNLDKQDNILSVGNIDEEQFNAIIDRVIELYAPVVSQHGATLKASKKWTNKTVNASSSQMLGYWVVNMYGGLARRPEITPDGFALVVCHELGHHLGGFPFTTKWAANEGQADYFATQVCARKLWKDDADENAKNAATVDPTAKAGCDKVWKTAAEQNLCYRVANASLSLGTLLAMIGTNPVAPKFDQPDSRIVEKTYNDHPAAQCRLDTYFAGAICPAAFDLKIIPGKGNADGQDSLSAEKEASDNSCMRAGGYSLGLRPLCWFAPRM